jgi:hypothetical protein
MLQAVIDKINKKVVKRSNLMFNEYETTPKGLSNRNTSSTDLNLIENLLSNNKSYAFCRK